MALTSEQVAKALAAIKERGIERRAGDTVSNEKGVATFKRADGSEFMWMPWDRWLELREDLERRLKSLKGEAK